MAEICRLFVFAGSCQESEWQLAIGGRGYWRRETTLAGSISMKVYALKFGPSPPVVGSSSGSDKFGFDSQDGGNGRHVAAVQDRMCHSIVVGRPTSSCPAENYPCYVNMYNDGESEIQVGNN